MEEEEEEEEDGDGDDGDTSSSKISNNLITHTSESDTQTLINVKRYQQ